MIVIGLQAGSFDLTKVGTSNSNWVFAPSSLAFAIKSPLWPLHGWLPDAYRSAPPEVAACCRAWRRRRAPTASCGSCCRSSPEPVSELRWRLVDAARDRAAVRLAARVPPARRARRDRLLVDRPDGPHRRSASSRSTPRASPARRSRWSTTACSRRRCSCSPAGSRTRPAGRVRAPRRDGARPAGPGHDRHHRRRRDARRARLERVRVRVPGPAGSVRGEGRRSA